MSVTEFDRDEGRESRASGGAQRRERQRQRRARLTAAPKKSIPWAAVLQTLMALALVVVVAAVFDWLQPVELAVVLTAYTICTAATYLVLDKLGGRRPPANANLLLGPITCGATVAVIAASMSLLQQFPETAAYTDRQVIEVQLLTDQLLEDHDLTGAVSHLESAIDRSESDFWKRRWTEQLRTIRNGEAENQSEDLVGQSVFPELIPIPDGKTTEQSGFQDSSSIPSAGSANTQLTREGFRRGAAAEASRASATRSLRLDQPDRSESVLNHFIRLQETKGFSVAESYLRKVIREEPRSNWQGDYQQWYVDHWIDWGNAHSDLDQRHLCFTRALRAARGFRLDGSVVSAMLVDLERRMQHLPSLLPAGCQVRIESVEAKSQEIRVELSIVTARQEFVCELKPKDFRVFRGDVELRGVSVSGGRLPQTERSLVVLVDQSESDSTITRARAEAAGQFCRNLPSDAAIQLMAFSTSIATSGWTTDVRTEMSRLPNRQPPTPSPVLRLAIQKALSALAEREGVKELIVFSGGRENSSPYTTATSLLQRTTDEGIRIHALLSEPSGSSVKQLLADLAHGSGGTLKMVTQSDTQSAWIELAEVFPRGNYVLRIPGGGTSVDELRIVIGRGATLLRTSLDVPLEARISAAQGRL